MLVAGSHYSVDTESAIAPSHHLLALRFRQSSLQDDRLRIATEHRNNNKGIHRKTNAFERPWFRLSLGPGTCKWAGHADGNIPVLSFTRLCWTDERCIGSAQYAARNRRAPAFPQSGLFAYRMRRVCRQTRKCQRGSSEVQLAARLGLSSGEFNDVLC